MSKVSVVFGAKTKPFEQGLQKLRGATSSWTKGIKGMVAGAFAFGAVMKGISEVRDEMSKLADLSKQGFSTDFLQDLALSASQAGTDLNTAATAVLKLSKELNSTRGPSQKIKDELQAIGLDMEKLKSMSPEELFKAVGGAIGGMRDDTDRAAAAMNLLGDAGANLIPLFEQMYTDGGLANAPKVSEAAIRATEEFNNALTELWTEIKTYLAPVFIVLLGLFEQCKILWNAFINSIAHGIIFWKDLFGDAWSMVKNFVENVGSQFSKLGDLIKALFTFDGDAIADAFRSLMDGMRDGVMDLMRDAQTLGGNVADNFVAGFNANLDELSKSGAVWQKALDGLSGKPARSVRTEGGSAGSPVERTGERKIKDNEGIKKLREEEKKLLDRLKALGKAAMDPSGMSVSSLQAIGGGGAAANINKKSIEKLTEQSNVLLKEIRDEIRRKEAMLK
jgi:conjugal transfer/entry exclusion protein